MILNMGRAVRIAISIVALLAAVFVLDGIDLPQQTRVWREFTNAGHAPMFGVVAVAILLLSRAMLDRKVKSPVTHYFIAFIGAVTMGGLTELGQVIGPRDASLGDLVNDVIGAAAFLGILATFDSRFRESAVLRRPVLRLTVRVTAVMIFLVTYIPFTILVFAHSHRKVHFPVICDFESYLDRSFAFALDSDLDVGPPPSGWSDNGSTAVARIKLGQSGSAGLGIQYPAPIWTGYSAFAVDIYLDAATDHQIMLRIDDTLHNFEDNDRFNRVLELSPGLNQVEIPLEEIASAPATRRMDMESIANIIIFAGPTATPATLYIDNIRLK